MSKCCHMLKNRVEVSMPQESTNTQSIVTADLYAQATQEDASSVQRREPGLKPSRMNGYSLLEARRHTRAMLSTRQLGATHKLSLPGWHNLTVKLCSQLSRRHWRNY